MRHPEIIWPNKGEVQREVSSLSVYGRSDEVLKKGGEKDRHIGNYSN